MSSLGVWEGNINTRDANKLNKLLRKANSVVVAKMDNLEEVSYRRMSRKRDAILENPIPSMMS